MEQTKYQNEYKNLRKDKGNPAPLSRPHRIMPKKGKSQKYPNRLGRIQGHGPGCARPGRSGQKFKQAKHFGLVKNAGGQDNQGSPNQGFVHKEQAV